MTREEMEKMAKKWMVRWYLIAPTAVLKSLTDLLEEVDRKARIP